MLILAPFGFLFQILDIFVVTDGKISGMVQSRPYVCKAATVNNEERCKKAELYKII